MSDLARKKCVPCAEGTKPLAGEQLKELQRQLGADWKVVDGHHLLKEYKLPDFKKALALTNRIGDVAEEMGHHPDIYLTWGKVRVEIFTHKVNGLTESDFVLAARVEELATQK